MRPAIASADRHASSAIDGTVELSIQNRHSINPAEASTRTPASTIGRPEARMNSPTWRLCVRHARTSTAGINASSAAYAATTA